MRRSTSSTIATRLRIAACALLLALPLQSARSQEVLSNESVVQMVTGKLSKDLIIAKINSSRPGFDLSSAGLVSLYGSKVDANIIKTMISSAQAARSRGDVPPSLTGMDEELTNEAVVRMVTGKVPKQIILSKIEMSRHAFDVSTSGLVKLNESKVPQDIIKVMMTPPSAPAVAPTKSAPTSSPPAAAPTTPTTPDKKAADKPPASTTKKGTTPPTTEKKPPVKKIPPPVG